MVTLQYGPEPSQYPAESAPKRHSWPLRGAERLQQDWFTPILRGVVLKRQNVVHLRPRVGPSTRRLAPCSGSLATATPRQTGTGRSLSSCWRCEPAAEGSDLALWNQIAPIDEYQV
jgi:hypothetical protein